MRGRSSPKTIDILIVDDRQENLQTLYSMLKKEGYRIRTAISAELALNSIEKSPPDLILLDVLLPDLNGYEVCKSLKAKRRSNEIPVIFVSALGETGDKLKAFEVGGVDYLTKPLQEQEVLARVRTHLALRATQQELEQKIAAHAESERQLTIALDEKDLLLKEVYHRTKNNMASICSLLRIQSMKLDDLATKEMLTNIENRIHSMLLVQEKLYQSHNYTNIDLKEYIADLSQRLLRNLHPKFGKISLELMLESAIVSADTAIPCGIILNELMTNAIKYAFPGESKGVIFIGLNPSPIEGETELIVGDNGIGMPTEMSLTELDSLGLQLVHSFVMQLNGTLEIKSEKGTQFTIRFQTAP